MAEFENVRRSIGVPFEKPSCAMGSHHDVASDARSEFSTYLREACEMTWSGTSTGAAHAVIAWT